MSQHSAVAGNRSGRQTVGQVMKSTQGIEPYAHLAAATYLIRHSHDPALVVMRCDIPVPLGTLAHSDLVLAIAEGVDPEQSLVKDIATRSRITTTAETAVEAAARLMRDQGLQRLPVVAAQRLVGIVELADCCGPPVGTSSIELSGNSR